MRAQEALVDPDEIIRARVFHMGASPTTWPEAISIVLGAGVILITYVSRET